MNERILIIEDDPKLRMGLIDNLAFEGFRPVGVWCAENGRKVWFEIDPAIVILDLMLPGKSGLQLLKEMRALGSRTPVIILSALGEEWDKIKGFRLGCDDYVVKPFSVIELIERIKAVLRRLGKLEKADNDCEFNGVKIDLQNRTAASSELKIELSEKLTELLTYFFRNPERVISRKELLEKVWFTSSEAETRTVDVHVASLRKALCGFDIEIETVYKAGYRLRVSKPIISR